LKIKETIIGFALALASCGNEGPDLSEQNLRAVGFGSYTEQFQTRGGEEATLTRGEVKRAIPDGGSMGVYAYYHDGSRWATDEENNQPNFMWNQQCTYNGVYDAFVYAPLKYWPNEENDKLSFIAYYPFTNTESMEGPESPASTGLTPLLTNSGKGLPSFEFTVKENAEDQVDLLVSNLIIDLPKTRDTEGDPGTPFNDLSIYDKVKFLFHHALSKVEFRVVADAEIRKDIVKFKLNSLNITNIHKTGTLTTSYDEGDTKLDWGSYSAMHGTAPANELSFKTYVPQLLVPQKLHPQTNEDMTKAMLNLDYEITFKSDGTTYKYDDATSTWEAKEDYTYKNEASLQLNTLKVTGTDTPLTEWLPHHHYIYTIRLRANRIEFTGEVVEWGATIPVSDIEIKEN